MSLANHLMFKKKVISTTQKKFFFFGVNILLCVLKFDEK